MLPKGALRLLLLLLKGALRLLLLLLPWDQNNLGLMLLFRFEYFRMLFLLILGLEHCGSTFWFLLALTLQLGFVYCRLLLLQVGYDITYVIFLLEN